MSEPESTRGDGGGGGLGRRFLIGGFQLGAGQWLSAALNFAIMIAVARMLGPADFGLYAFVFSINEFLNIVGAFSLQVALIQAREAPQRLFDTAFAMSFGLGVIGLLAALPVALVLGGAHSQRAAWMLLALGVARLLRLLAQVPYAHLERRLRYGPITVITVVTGNLPNLCAIGFAWRAWGAWALIGRDVLMTVLLFGMTWTWSGYRFRGEVDRPTFRYLFDIAKRLFTAVSVGIVVERVDRVAVGAALGDAATGLYQQARYLAETGFLAIRPVSQLALNLYARVQDDPARLSRSHDLVNLLFVRAMLLGAVALLTFPGEVIQLLLGEEWLGAAPLLRAFGVFAVLVPLIDNVRVLFYGTGHVDRNVRVAVTQALVVVPGVLWGAWAGSLHGVAAAVIVSVFVAFGVSWVGSRDLVERHPVRLFAAPLLLAAASVAACLAARGAGLLSGLPGWSLPFLPPLLYGAGLLAVERRRLREELGYLRGQLARPSGAGA